MTRFPEVWGAYLLLPTLWLQFGVEKYMFVCLSASYYNSPWASQQGWDNSPKELTQGGQYTCCHAMAAAQEGGVMSQLTSTYWGGVRPVAMVHVPCSTCNG